MNTTSSSPVRSIDIDEALLRIGEWPVGARKRYFASEAARLLVALADIHDAAEDVAALPAEHAPEPKVWAEFVQVVGRLTEALQTATAVVREVCPKHAVAIADLDIGEIQDREPARLPATLPDRIDHMAQQLVSVGEQK